MRVDAHQHFWFFNPERDGWITEEMKAIRKDFLPENLHHHLLRNNIDGCVAIQADQSEKETESLLELANRHSFIQGIVGWVDLMSDNFMERLNHYKQNAYFKGVRHILQAEAEGFMCQPQFIKAVGSLNVFGLTYDILTTESQLDELLEFIRSLPEMNLVIDHISKPNIKSAAFEHWSKRMKEISAYEHVYVKLSGMLTEADWGNWNTSQLKPYIDFCLEHFGPNRLMFGSDWPVCLLAASYDQTIDALYENISELSQDEQEQIMGITAINFYNLKEGKWT